MNDAAPRLLDEVVQLLDEDAPTTTINKLIDEHAKTVQRSHNRLLLDVGHIARKLRKTPEEVQQAVLPHLLRAGGPRSPERLVVWSRRAGLSLEQLPSFTICSNNRAYQKHSAQAPAPEGKIVSSKREGYRLAEQLGVKTPTYDSKPSPLEKLEFRPDTVVKPPRGEGSAGVYLIRDESHIISVVNGQVFSGYDELRARMRQNVETLRTVQDAWLTEEIIYEDKATKTPARDLKFYTFYGEAPLVLEVVRSPFKGFTWWDADGNKTTTGKYKNLDFEGNGFTKEAYDAAVEISKAIPAPFIRVDFLNGEDGPVLGEFTGHPGKYEQFNRATDRLLGRHFLEAEARLFRDLLGRVSYLA